MGRSIKVGDVERKKLAADRQRIDPGAAAAVFNVALIEAGTDAAAKHVQNASATDKQRLHGVTVQTFGYR